MHLGFEASHVPHRLHRSQWQDQMGCSGWGREAAV